MHRVVRMDNLAQPLHHDIKAHNATVMEQTAKAKNTALEQSNWNNLYRTVYSDPCVTGKASHRFVAPDNYFGISHYTPLSTAILYNVGIPSGHGKDPFKTPIRPNKQFSMCGE